MTEADRHTRYDSFYAHRETIASPPPDLPWPLVAVAVACISGVTAGSLGP